MEKYRNILNELEAQHNLRSLPSEVPEGMINLSSNDYLGLAGDADLKRSFLESTDLAELSFTASSSRLLTGNSNEYGSLENDIAGAYQKEGCAVFNSGYHANIGILPALTGKNDLIVADKYVHASLIDGCKLCDCDFKRFNHLDINHLDDILKKHRSQYENVFIVVESMFSMDGDMSDILSIIEIKNKYNALLYVDEAHTVGILGARGYGLCEELGVLDDIDILVGTFGKALASVGAYVVCNNLLKDVLVNRSRSLIYTTALPPVNLAWSSFVFSKLHEFSEQRNNLNILTKFVAQKLNRAQVSHIVPLIIGENDKSVELAAYLQKNGYYVMPIKHPTVPKGTARVRLSLKADVTINEMEPIFELIYGCK